MYGAGVKNTLGYIEVEDFDVLLDICDYLGVKPLCIFRFAPKTQINEIRRRGGFAWIFKTRIYPPGNRTLVNAIYNTMGLPVQIWRRVPDSTAKRFLDWHERQIEK
ncbi:MAG: hypothetical protein QMC77_04705 [Methanocellales archaeon]|nr:hypothetical protein [Methanocellales archaeon]